jgi:hypothetical protein
MPSRSGMQKIRISYCNRQDGRDDQERETEQGEP